MTQPKGIKPVVGTGKALLVPLAVYLIFLVLAPDRFGSLKSMHIILLQSIIPTVMAYGMCIGMVAGLIDLSPGARVIVASIVGGLLSVPFGLAGLVIGSVVAGVILGFVTGGIYTVLRIPSLVVSIGLVMVFEVVAVQISGRGSLITIPQKLSVLGYEPYNVIIGLFCFVLFYLIYYRTRFGFHIRAIGGNELVGKLMGIRTTRVKLMTFVVGGIFMGIASVLQISYASSIAATINMGSLPMVFQPIMGMMVGIQFQRFCNLALGILIGEFSLSMIFTGLIAMGLPSTMQNVVLGVFLLIVMGVSANRGLLASLRRHKRSVVPPTA